MNIELVLAPMFGVNRKAIFECLIYNQRSKTVTTQWGIYPTTAEGQIITSAMFRTATKELIADESTMVNPATGDYVVADADGNYPEGSITEYAYFVYVAENVPVKVHELILAAGQKAVAAGRFDAI